MKGLNRKLTRKERILNKVQPSVKSEAEKNLRAFTYIIRKQLNTKSTENHEGKSWNELHFKTFGKLGKY